MSLRTKSTQCCLVFDMMSPKGHIRLNRFYLSQVLNGDFQLFVSRDLVEEYKDFEVCSLGERLRGAEISNRLSLAYRVLRIVLLKMPTNVVFLSYDLATFPLVSNVLQKLSVDVVCFEHNTAPSSKLRGWFHSFSAKNVRRLVYTPYLQDRYLSLGLKAEYVPHPCLPCEVQTAGSQEWASIAAKGSHGYTRIALCPSGSVTVAQMEEVACLYPDVLFVMKSKESSRLLNLLSLPYFKDYGIAMNQCDFAVIPFSSEHRVSGPVFEAIAAGKQVMVLNNLFGKYVKSLFQGKIFFCGEALPDTDVEADFCLSEYNRTIVQMLSTTVNGASGTGLSHREF